MQKRAYEAERKVKEKTGFGSEFLGWVNLPSVMLSTELSSILEAAKEIRENCDTFIVIGIGGSYLGARAAIEALSSMTDAGKSPSILYAGNNMSSDNLCELIDCIKEKNVYVNVISKSGTTTEPAIAFRFIRDFMVKKYGKESSKRIIATTDKSRGALKEMADNEGYRTFVIPDDVGGRFSVLTAVGLLPIAVAGIDIKSMLEGARDMSKVLEEDDLRKNSAHMYAALRNILYEKGKYVEILANFNPKLHYFSEWWKQLYGESEGKNGQGIYPAAVDFTTDLHSMGQWIQSGRRIIFETFIDIETPSKDLEIPSDSKNLDGLNYIAGKTVDYVNHKAKEGVAMAHASGGVPNMTVSIPRLDAYHLGELFYFFEKAVAVSGYLLGVNPFDQPGVEAYKSNMFKLLGKPS
ncbi:MAG: glucose-6-phosphate isomerase [Firmicutes bacterium]|nr:glucose-6-phosphate isomerase [Bacillota bacterium]